MTEQAISPLRLAPASCLPPRSLQAMEPPALQPSSLKRLRVLAPAAVAAWSSSRPSNAAAHHALTPPHRQPRSGSIAHDHVTAPLRCSHVRRLSARHGVARSNHPALVNRTADPASRATQTSTQFNDEPSPRFSSPPPNTSQPRLPGRHISQIPIAAAPQTSPHRGFVP
jgi:hypothetical protein